MPTLAGLARRGRIGRAQVIPQRMPPGSDVGNMSILGYDPRVYHSGRAPIEAAAQGIELAPGQVAFRCNLVTLSEDDVMLDYAGGHPSNEQAAEVIEAVQAELGGEVRFCPGKQYRHLMIAPGSWAQAECVPPHDITGRQAVPPGGLRSGKLRQLMEASREIVGGFDIEATQIWLWGQGTTPRMPSFKEKFGAQAAMVSAVDLVRGLGVLTGMEVVDVQGANAWYDTNYEGKRDAALSSLEGGADLFVIHVEATDEAGHAGDVAAKVRALENWDARILADLKAGLDSLGKWRMLLLPDHATPIETRTHTSEPVPYLLVDSTKEFEGGSYNEAAAANAPVMPGHHVMSELLKTNSAK